MKPSETLTKVRELLQDEARWTQRAYARDAEGRDTYSADKVMGRCLLNAMVCVVTPRSGVYDITREQKYLEQVVNRRVQEFNDDPRTTHPDVLNALDAAIALAKKDEQANEAE